MFSSLPNITKKLRRAVTMALIAVIALTPLSTAFASSHMDAPLITLDPAANTTDVYAFVDDDNGKKSLVVALGVYPHQHPGIGPNKYNFDDTVRYDINIALGNDVARGNPTISYQFQFKTRFKNENTILQSYLGVVQNVDDAAQNLTQTYSVTRLDRRTGHEMRIGNGIVPPNNQGNATPFYNQGDNGENPARKGVAQEHQLDRYTQQAIAKFNHGYVAFAGQRDDGFYADIQSIFDLLKLRNPGRDSQGGFNVHLMALSIPLSELGGDQQTVGVFGTTNRISQPVLFNTTPGRGFADLLRRRPQFVQVARQGNPLFNEGLVALADKDLYSSTLPVVDANLFRKYAENPELATLINLIIGGGQTLAIDKKRADIAAIYIPDVIKVDLSTGAARLAGNGPVDPNNADDQGFSRLGIFGGDILESRAAGHPFRLPGRLIGADATKSFVPGGWPNGRRFGDDVVDIAIIALLSDLRDPNNLKIADPFRGNYDGVTSNDMGFNKVFPYESTPQNGRNNSFPK